MTTEQIPEIPSAVLTDWPRAYAAYQATANAIIRADQDIPNELIEAHETAARALIECPASALVHIGQKIRAVENLVHIDQLYPNLSAILLRDVFGLMGIDHPDQPPLPPPFKN